MSYKPELDGLTSLQLILKAARLGGMIRGGQETGYYMLDTWWFNDYFVTLPMPVSEVLYHELRFYRDPKEAQKDDSKAEATCVLWEKLHAFVEVLSRSLKVCYSTFAAIAHSQLTHTCLQRIRCWRV